MGAIPSTYPVGKRTFKRDHGHPPSGRDKSNVTTQKSTLGRGSQQTPAPSLGSSKLVIVAETLKGLISGTSLAVIKIKVPTERVQGNDPRINWENYNPRLPPESKENPKGVPSENPSGKANSDPEVWGSRNAGKKGISREWVEFSGISGLVTSIGMLHGMFGEKGFPGTPYTGPRRNPEANRPPTLITPGNQGGPIWGGAAAHHGQNSPVPVNHRPVLSVPEVPAAMAAIPLSRAVQAYVLYSKLNREARDVARHLVQHAQDHPVMTGAVVLAGAAVVVLAPEALIALAIF